MGLLLLIPAIDGVFNIIDDRKLDGAVVLSDDAAFSWKGWWDGSWQPGKEAFLNDHFGYRGFFVRLYHELDFRIFGNLHARSVIYGKEGYLYEKDYITSYYGEDYIGHANISDYVHLIKRVQDIIEQQGKTFLLVIASDKGSFYPEYFPDDMRRDKRDTTNYQVFLEEAKKSGIHFMDLSAQHRALKGKTEYLLYPKNGIHWSTYAMFLAADTMIKYIEQHQHLVLPHYRWSETELLHEKDQDYDLGRGLNLLFPLSGPKLGYPKAHTDFTNVKKKLSSVIIADSFYWGLFNMGFSEMFSDSKFWFYNNEIYPDHYNSPTFTRDVDIKETIGKNDVFILMATEHNAYRVGWGFINRVAEAYPEN